MVKKKKETREKGYESLKDKTGPIRKEKIDKVIQMQEKKRIDAVTQKKKGIPIAYAALIVIVIAALGAVLLFAVPRFNTAPVKAGDMVQIIYVLKLQDGSVFETGNFSFRVNSSEVIQGVDEAMIGMRVGDKKTITVTPDKAYGYYDESKIMDVPLVNERNITMDIDIDAFNASFGEMPILNKTYYIEGMEWDLRVIDIQNSTVKLEDEVQNGTTFDMKNYAGEIYAKGTVNIEGNKLIMTTHPIKGGIIYAPTLYGYEAGKIVDFNETHMNLDFNNPLASKTLTFEITLLSMISY